MADATTGAKVKINAKDVLQNFKSGTQGTRQAEARPMHNELTAKSNTLRFVAGS